MKSSIHAAVDIGGTFTDLVAIDKLSNESFSAKVPTTPQDLSQGVVNAVEKSQISLERCGYFVHGTTVGLNAFLQRAGAKTALITTKGFRDVLEIARMSRDGMYNLWYKRPTPFVPRPLRVEVTERVDSNGEVLEPLDDSEVRKAIHYFQSKSVESIAVCFLHSYANPKHEKMAGKIITREAPDLPFSLSHQVAREYREYERTSTTVLDAYIKPKMSLYVRRLQGQLESKGFRGKLMITLSSGGVRNAGISVTTPIKAFNSGPVGGVVGASSIATLTKSQNMIGIDAGGTSFDVSLIIDHRPTLAEQTIVDSYPILAPAIDIRSIGAGGGSIAWIDEGGHLHVGPRSAGADPGPMCYGRGGLEATVTDAALHAGILDPDYFLGGALRLEPKLAAKGIEHLSRTLGMPREEAALGILSIVTANMAGVIREITVGQGHDPREFTILSYGGATSMLVADLASELGIGSVVVPREPGNFSAWGMLFMDMVYDYSRTFVSKFEESNIASYERIFRELEEEGSRALVREGVKAVDRRFLRFVDLRYEWQSHYLQVPIAQERFDRKVVASLEESFHELHARNYGHRRSSPVQTVHLRAQAVGSLPKPKIPTLERHGSKSARLARKGVRKVWVKGGDLVSFEVYDRSRLTYGNTITGPAIIEEETSTTLIREGDELSVDRLGNLILGLETKSGDNTLALALKASTDHG